MKTPIRTLLVLLLVAVSTGAAQPPNPNGLGWRWQNPLPQGNHLRDIAALDAQTVVAVGDNGTILRSTDGGQAWEPQSSGTPSDLWGVSFSDPLTGTAVGAAGTVVRTTDGGATWLSTTIESAGTLRGVKFLDAVHGTAIEELGRIFRTSDGGVSWSPITIPTSLGLFSIAFRTPLNGFAVGAAGRIFATSDGGDTWIPRPSPTTQPLYAIFFATPDFGVAAGLGGVILRTTDGGTTWSEINLGSLIPLYGVAFGDVLHGVAVGLPGITYVTSDGGLTWSPRPSGTSQLLWKATFTDPLQGFAVGDNGVILNTLDGGFNWHEQSSGTTASLFGVSFADLNRGVAVGDAGTIILTTNAGTSWVLQGGGTSQTLWSVSMGSPTTGTAVGSSGAIVHSTNGGVTWLPQSSGTGQQLFGVSHINAATALAVGGGGIILRTTNGGTTWAQQSSGTVTGLNAVQMVDASTAYAAGNGGALRKSTNGGVTWTGINTGTSANLFGLSFSSPSTGTLVGAGGTILRTTDGGANWMTQSAGTSGTLNAVSFAGSNAGTVVGNGGLILRTGNGGVTWTQQPSGTTNSLMAVDLADANHGTAVGFSGTILYTNTGGEAPAPAFSADPSDIDFGEVAVGSSRADTIVVTNTGTALLSISEVVSDNSRFTVTPGSALINAGNSRLFFVTFSPVSTGPKNAAIVFTSNAAGSPDSVTVHGSGVVDGLGTYLSLPPDSLIQRDLLTGRMVKPVKRGRHLYPNWANLISEVFIQGGFQPRSSQSDSAGSMRIGVAWMQQVGFNKWKPRPDSASVRCWVRIGRWNFSRALGSGWTNLQATLWDNTGAHTGIPRGFDATGVPGDPGRKPLVKQLSKLPPKKHSNRLYAELVALKLNIAASQLGKTPVGFGELLYQRPGNLCNNLTISEIAAVADRMMTYWHGGAQADYDSLYAAIHEVNRAFAAPLDTLSFEADNELILDGSVDLSSVPFLKPGHHAAVRIPRTTDIVDDPDAFEDGDGDEGAVPPALKLYQNYPNPFNPLTTIGFRLAEPSRVRARVFDLLGREVASLASDEDFEDGFQELEFDGTGFASGIYFYRIEATAPDGEAVRHVVTGKMLLLK